MSVAYRAVLFDFFGTLTEAIRRGPAHRDIARRLGCGYDAYRDALDRTFLARTTGAFGTPAQALQFIARLAGGDPDRATLEAALMDRERAVREDVRIRPEAVPVLTTLRRFGLATALISDCGPELPAFLPMLPVAPLLDVAVLSIEVGQRKPHPAMYATACDRLGVAASECLYVGDGGSRELTGAAAFGMTAVRLDAPDLVDHLVFDSDDWSGERIDSLTDVFDALHRVPACR